MPGLGTLVNVLAIVVGGIIGLICRKALSKKLQDSMISAMGLCTLFIGLSGALSHILKIQESSLQTTGTLMLIASLTIGVVVGELLDLEKRIVSFGEWIKQKTGSKGDGGFVNAFVVSSLTVCIGAMAVVGSIQDGLVADHSVLFAKSILDLIIIAVFSASMGRGCLFSAIPVGLFQGSITLFAVLLAPFVTDQSMADLSLTGSVLIFCVGVNLLWPGKFRVANMLPALLVSFVWSWLPF